MSDLLLARSQMAMSLGFHIVFAAVGVALPLLMVIAEWRFLRTGDPIFLALAKRWAKGTAILFAVGAVSGTVLSFELGLLWPRFMAHAGAIIGMPFSLEGFAFFTEAIFLGVYLYGWERVSPPVHLASGIAVMVFGAGSAFFVVLANAWMNSPSGFRLSGGQYVDIDPLRAMFSPGWQHEVIHVLLSSYLATALIVAGIHAKGLLRNAQSRFHRRAFEIAFAIFAVTAILQPISGHTSTQSVAVRQPAKLAALEGHFHTGRNAPLHLGGLPDPETQTTPYAIELPGVLSFLAFGDRQAEVRGLNEFPRRDWPNPRVTHLAFQLMVALGGAFVLLALAAAAQLARSLYRGRRRPEPDRLPWSRQLLGLWVIASPLGFVAIEAGWTVTEVGRQPWTIYGVLRTADAVTPATGLLGRFVVFAVIYLFLGAVVAVLLGRQIAATQGEHSDEELIGSAHGPAGAEPAGAEPAPSGESR